MVILNATYLGSATLYKTRHDISEHNVLKNSNNFKEHQFYEILYMWSKLLNRVNLIIFILLEYLK